jgi:predicted nucleic acid-binding protein
MIYFDTAYIIKCYLPEAGHIQVRELLRQQSSAACCSYGRLEFAAAIQRAIREGRLPLTAKATVFSILASDDQNGVWNWIPLSLQLVETTTQAIQSLPPNLTIRAADALHLVCAREQGYRRIYTNDRHMLAAAAHFGLQPMNVIP